MSKERDYINKIEGAERRFFVAPVTVEKRAEAEPSEDGLYEIEGYAFKFNTRANIAGLFEEEILPEARDESRLLDDVRCLFNHSPNKILARSNKGEGTLHLEFDNIGLKYRYRTPKRSYAIDLQDAIEQGDVNQSSFAFLTKEDKWIERENEIPLRQIVKFKEFFDVSPVTYPAYPDASVGKRSLDAFAAKDMEVETEEVETPKEERASLDVFEAQYMFNQNQAK